jgi:threonine dehydratase
MSTPLEEAPPELARGCRLLLKREDAHELGAFKWRGALPSLRRYRDRGAEAVVTASTGNHGAATAWAAQRTGMRALVFAPEGASRAKVEAMRDLGAELHLVGTEFDEAKELGREFAAERSLPFFEDGAEPAQFEGYGAIATELVEELGEPPAAVIAPVGNGALLAGIARALPDGERIGVVSKEAPVMALSVAAGRPVESDRSGTFADGIAVRVAVPLAVAELAALGVRMVEVSERSLARAVGAFHAAGIRVEGAGAASLAGLDELDHLPEGPVVLIVSGRNIDDELHRRAVEQPESFDP